MSDQTDEVEAAASELTHAMTRFVRAVDAVGDDGEAGRHLPEKLSESLDALATRVGAALGFGA